MNGDRRLEAPIAKVLCGVVLWDKHRGRHGSET